MCSISKANLGHGKIGRTAALAVAEGEAGEADGVDGAHVEVALVVRRK